VRDRGIIEGLTFEAAPEAVTRPLVSLIVPALNELDAVIPFVQAIDGMVQLSRNFGKEAALSAGLKASRGDAVAPMDVDLQDPPELLRPMIDRWQSGVQVVNARRCDRSSDTMFKRSSAQLFYKAINSLADHPIAEGVGDFRLFDRAAVDALNQMTEHSRFNKGLFSWIGFRTETLDYVRP
jgi:glycosyltransferase involved in cell wall biosynthesis